MAKIDEHFVVVIKFCYSCLVTVTCIMLVRYLLLY